MSAYAHGRCLFTIPLIGFYLLAAPFLAQSAKASNETWTGASNSNFSYGGNWSNPNATLTGVAPGVAATTFSNTDTALFNSSAQTTAVTFDTSRNLGLISFDTAVGSYTFSNSTGSTTGDNSYYGSGVSVASSSAGKDIINIAYTTTSTSATESFNVPIVLGGNVGIGNDASSTRVTLNIGGNISSSASGTNVILNLNGNNFSNNTVSGLISGAIMVSKGSSNGSLSSTGVPGYGNGLWILSNDNNSFTGGTTVIGGSGTNLSTLSVATIGTTGSNSALGTNATVNIAANGVLRYTGGGESSNKVINLSAIGAYTSYLDASGTGTLTLTGNSTAGTSAITSVGGAAKTLTLTLQGTGAGAITGAIAAPTTSTAVLGLTKAGTGTWTINNASSANIAGPVMINAGTLNVSGSLGAITLSSGATLFPGTASTATGALTGASLAFSSGGVLSFVLSSTDNTSNTLTLLGAFTKTGSATTGYNFNLSGGVVGDTYDLVNYNTTTFNSTSVFTNTGSTPGTFSLATSNELTFIVSAVPEPSTWVFGMMMVGFMGVTGLRRYKSCQSAA